MKKKKSKLGAELIESMKEMVKVARGEILPSKVWNLTRQPDGTIKRELLDPREVQKENRARWERKQALKAREALGLSQSEFAKLLGVSKATLQNWEQGRRKPTGAARVLLLVAARSPKTVLEAVAA